MDSFFPLASSGGGGTLAQTVNKTLILEYDENGRTFLVARLAGDSVLVVFVLASLAGRSPTFLEERGEPIARWDRPGFKTVNSEGREFTV